MGFFSERCVKCGSRVSKKADYCSGCGAPRSGAWRKCHSCGASVGADSHHCWRCSADLSSQATNEIFGDRWRRSAGDFAVRFPLRMPEGVVHHGVQVDAGTVAVITVNGRFEATLDAGYHAMSSFWERFSGLEKKGQHAEAILAAAAPMTLMMPISGLFDCEQVPLTALMHLEVCLANPRVFVERGMVGRQTFGSEDVVAVIGEEARDAVQKRAVQYRVEDLLVDVSQREALEAVLRPEMRRILEQIGMEMSQVRLARFSGEAVEALRARLGEKAVRIRNYEVDRELHALERTQRLKGVETDYEFNEIEKQLAHDFSLKDGERTRLREIWEQQAGHSVRMDKLRLDFEEEKARRDSARELRRDERGDELSETRHGTALAGAEEDTVDVRYQRGLDRERRELAAANEARREQLEMMRSLKEIKLAEKRAEAEIETESITSRAQALHGLNPEAIIAATGSSLVADNLVRLAEVAKGRDIAFRPGPFNQNFGAPGGAGFGNPYGGGGGMPGMFPGPAVSPCFGGVVGNSEDQKLQDVARRAMGAVGLIGLTGGSDDPTPVGTGWLVGPRVLATNAHVAQSVMDGVKAGHSCWVAFGGEGGARNARVERAVIHPKYGDAGPGPRGAQPAVPPCDVALLILDHDQPLALPLARPEVLQHLTPGSRVAYLGFPMEGMAGGGVNFRSPAAIFKSGVVSQVTDWWLGHAEFPQSFLIQHDLGVAGGASGSPLLDTHGSVVGIVSAGNMASSVDVTSGAVQRIPSGVVLNFAQRIDLLGDLLAQPDPDSAFF